MNNNHYVPWLNSAIIQVTGIVPQRKCVLWYTTWDVWDTTGEYPRKLSHNDMLETRGVLTMQIHTRHMATQMDTNKIYPGCR